MFVSVVGGEYSRSSEPLGVEISMSDLPEMSCQIPLSRCTGILRKGRCCDYVPFPTCDGVWGK